MRVVMHNSSSSPPGRRGRGRQRPGVGTAAFVPFPLACFLLALCIGQRRIGVSASQSQSSSVRESNTVLRLPFRLADLAKEALPRLFSKSDDDAAARDMETRSARVMSSSVVRSVSAPKSDLLPPDVVDGAARASGLIGGTLLGDGGGKIGDDAGGTPVGRAAEALNGWYAREGYVLNAVTGAALVGDPDDGRVELAVREVRLERKSANNCPLTIRFVDPAPDAEATDGKADPAEYRPTTGRTRASAVARSVGLRPGGHFRIVSDKWTSLIAGGGGGGSAVFSKVHAVRPVRRADGREHDGVTVEVIATENKPHIGLEYGIGRSASASSTSMSSSQQNEDGRWECSLDARHSNAFGGGEVAALSLRRGRGDPALLSPPGVRITLKDGGMGGPGGGGYDVEAYHEYAPDEDRTDAGFERTDGGFRRGKSSTRGPAPPGRTGASLRLRFPRSGNAGTSVASVLLPRAATASIARTMSATASTTASLSADAGPYRPFASSRIRSALFGTASTGVRLDDGAAGDDGGAASTPASPYYASGAASLLQSTPVFGGRAVLASRLGATAATAGLPPHEATALGRESRVRGYRRKRNNVGIRGSSPSKEEKKDGTTPGFDARALLGDLFDGGGRGDGAGPVRRSVSGTIELRVPVATAADADAAAAGRRRLPSSLLPGGTAVLFGDWSLARSTAAEASPNGEGESAGKIHGRRGFFGRSSVGVGYRKTVQGMPLRCDACVTECGDRGVFFGIGRDFDA